MTHAREPQLDDLPLYNRDVVILLLAGVAYFTLNGIAFPVLPRLVEDELGGGDTEIGLAFGATAIGMLSMRLFVGYLADRIGRRPLIAIGAMGVGTLQLAHVPAAGAGLVALLAVRVAVGLFSSLMYVGQATTATELPPRHRSGEIFATFSTAVFVGLAIGPLVGEPIQQSFGFGAAFGVAAAIGWGAAGLSLLLPETRPDDAVATYEGLRSLVHPIAARAGVVSFLLFVSFTAFNAFATPYGESLGLDQVRWVLLAFSGATLLTRALGGRLIDRIDRRRLGSAAHVTVLVGLAVIVVFDSVWSLYAGGLVMASGLAFNVPLMMTIAADSARPQERSRVVATVILFGDLAQSLGAFVLGVVAEHAGYRGMYLVVWAMALTAAALFRSPFMAPLAGLDRRR